MSSMKLLAGKMLAMLDGGELGARIFEEQATAKAREEGRQEAIDEANARRNGGGESTKKVGAGGMELAAPGLGQELDIPATWEEKARKLADGIGCREYASGIRQINPNSICEKVAVELARDEKTHGKRGPRSGAGIKNIALKGWKLDPTKCTNGLNEN